MTTPDKSRKHKLEEGIAYQATRTGRWVMVRKFMLRHPQPHMDLCFHIGLWPELPAEQCLFVQRLIVEMMARVFPDDEWDAVIARQAQTIMRAVNEVLYGAVQP